MLFQAPIISQINSFQQVYKIYITMDKSMYITGHWACNNTLIHQLKCDLILIRLYFNTLTLCHVSCTSPPQATDGGGGG